MCEAPNRIYHAKMEFPVAAGPLTLVYPKWIPGEHGPNGPIVDVAGLKSYAGGKEIPWLRDDVDMFAFHCNIPPSANTLEVTLDYLAPGTTSTAKLSILNWNLVLLYPLGPKSDDLTFVATLKIPQGWKYATAFQRVPLFGEPHFCLRRSSSMLRRLGAIGKSTGTADAHGSARSSSVHLQMRCPFHYTGTFLATFVWIQGARSNDILLIR